MKRWLGMVEHTGFLIGRSYRLAIAFVSGFRSVQQKKRALPPSDQKVLTLVQSDNRLAEFIVAEPGESEAGDTAPQPDRTVLVQSVLDEAWAQGLTTYDQLIAYVKQQTGEGCSRRAIAAWKRERNLMADAA